MTARSIEKTLAYIGENKSSVPINSDGFFASTGKYSHLEARQITNFIYICFKLINISHSLYFS